MVWKLVQRFKRFMPAAGTDYAEVTAETPSTLGEASTVLVELHA
jgi:hypothetical protein